MFRNSVEAFAQLIEERRTTGIAYNIVDISTVMDYMENGLKFCSVQVRYEAGDEYQIQAYGDEADELYREAEKISSAIKGEGVKTKQKMYRCQSCDGVFLFESDVEEHKVKTGHARYWTSEL